MFEVVVAKNRGSVNFSGGTNDGIPRILLQTFRINGFNGCLKPAALQVSSQALQADEPFVSFAPIDFKPSVLVRLFASSSS
jgi:hypothetical protein